MDAAAMSKENPRSAAWARYYTNHPETAVATWGENNNREPNCDCFNCDPWAAQRKPIDGIDYEWRSPERVRAIVAEKGKVLRYGPWCDNSGDATFELAHILAREIREKSGGLDENHTG